MPPDGSAEKHAPVAVVFARPSLSCLIELVLRHLGVRTAATASATRARELVLSLHPALLVTDIGRGPSARRLLEKGSARATLALIDLDGGASSTTAFRGGAGDVMRVPFTPDELAVRAAQLLRRYGVTTSLVRNVAVQGVELSLDEYAHVGSRTIALSAPQNSLLYLLVANAGRRIAQADVRELCWGVEHTAGGPEVEGAIAGLERSLAPSDVLRIERVKGGVVARMAPA